MFSDNLTELKPDQRKAIRRLESEHGDAACVSTGWDDGAVQVAIAGRVFTVERSGVTAEAEDTRFLPPPAQTAGLGTL